MKNDNLKLEVETTNLLLKKEDAVFITSDETCKSDFFVLFRELSGQWKFVWFNSVAKNNNQMFATVGKLELFIDKSVTKKFALLCCGSYSFINHLYELINTEPATDFASYNDYAEAIKKPQGIKKAIRIVKSLDEKTLLQVLRDLSIEY